MAKAPKKSPDIHYSFRKLNIVFAWSSLALLAVTVWMVFADYAKPWKRLQAEFRDRERAMVAAEAQAEKDKLNQEQIAQVQADIQQEETALAEQRGELSDLEDELTKLSKKVYAADATSRQTKSILDEARYKQDVASQDGDAELIAKRQSVVDELAATLRENRIALEDLTDQRDHVQSEIEAKRARLEEAEDRLAALRSGLTNLEQRVANLDKKIDYFLLNAPLMDFVLPDLKVEQMMLSGLYQNINFANVDRVDRCMTCHVAANRAGFDDEEWEEPFRSHPRLDLYLGASSPHPYTQFGCTTCHQGLDRATDFARAGHSPTSEAQREEWKKKWGWKPQKYLDTPILPGKYTEAGCVTCHSADVWTVGSELQDVGRELATRFGCYGCHTIDLPAFTDLPRPGPALRSVAGKTNPAWAYKWIESPRDFHPTTWMPHFFYQENIAGDLNLERQKAEINSLVAYIWDVSDTPEYPEPPAGNAERGKALFESVGCEGCHVKDGAASRDQFYPEFNRMHGPNLVRTGSKVSAGWLYAWVKDPKAYNADTRMPSLRLTDQEAADVVAYLMADRDPAFENLELPEVDGKVRDDLVLDYLQETQTIEQSEATLAGMNAGERDVYLGERTVRKYGCYACHEVDGFDDAKPIGVELSEAGSKPVHQYDFGHVHHAEFRTDRLNPVEAGDGDAGHDGEHGEFTHREIAHTRHDWIKTKLMRPRIWDQGKELIKSYGELYKMPDFGMSEREAEAVLSTVLGMTKESVRAHRKAGLTAQDKATAAGRKLITRYNCQACHLIEGQGRAIRTAIDDVGLLPPNLAAQGARVQTDWLFKYLHDPASETMRPWLSVRMPTFGFQDDEVNTALAYFNAQDDRGAFLSPPTRPSARNLTVGRLTFNMLQCAKCHPAGPDAVAAAGAASAAELAPSLLLGPERLRHDWVPSWVLDPQSWVTGTNMPSNFAKKDDGTYDSPLALAIDAPMFRSQKEQMLRHFDSEEELKEYLGDAEQITVALRDHIWWNLAR